MTDRQPDLRVKIGSLAMKNPVMTASGTYGFGKEYAQFLDLSGLGAIVVKGLTLEARKGNPGRRIVETPSGILNSIGLQNPGVEYFIAQELPFLQEYDVPVIANIAGNTLDEYARIAEKVTIPGIDALEINISCPNVKKGGLAFGTDCISAAGVVSTVKQNTNLPIIVKLSPNVTDIVEIALAVEQAGADGISLINTLLGMAIDIHSWQPKLGNIVGGLSGPAVKPIAIRMVWQVANAVKIPVVGMGGIMNVEDAVEFLLAGATAVAIGTANFVNPKAPIAIVEGLEQYMKEKAINEIGDIIGKVRVSK